MGIDIESVNGSGPDGAIRERDVMQRASAPAVKATPLAAKLAGELNIDLSQLRGSGTEGKITREDVERAARDSCKANRHPSNVMRQARHPNLESLISNLFLQSAA